MMFFSKRKSHYLAVITFLVLISLASISKADPYESDLPETLTHPSPIYKEPKRPLGPPAGVPGHKNSIEAQSHSLSEDKEPKRPLGPPAGVPGYDTDRNIQLEH